MKRRHCCSPTARRPNISAQTLSPVDPHRPAEQTPRARTRLLALIAVALVVLPLAAACYSIASPQGWADPVFSANGNTVYYSLGHGNLAAYDIANKKELWQFPNDQQKQIKLQAIYSTPVLDSQSIYFGAYNGFVYGLDQATGNIRWQTNRGAPIVGGLLLSGNTLYVGDSNGEFAALSTTNGDVLWQHQAGQRIWSTPVEANGLIVVPSMDKRLYAFDQQGNLAWKSDVATAAIASTPLVFGSELAFGGFDKRFHAVQDNNGGKVWISPEAGNWFWTRGLISGDNLYAGNLDGHVYDFDSSTGQIKWQMDVGAGVRSAPVLVQSSLVVADINGIVHILNPDSGQSQSTLDAGGKIYANLIAQSGQVYALTEASGKANARLLQIDPSRGSLSSVGLY